MEPCGAPENECVKDMASTVGETEEKSSLLCWQTSDAYNPQVTWSELDNQPPPEGGLVQVIDLSVDDLFDKEFMSQSNIDFGLDEVEWDLHGTGGNL